METLSTADCQIVEILKAPVSRNARILVMDEPTSSLSETEATRLLEDIGVADWGLAIVYISHRLEEVTGLADDISILRDGKVVHSSGARGAEIGTIVHHMVGRELQDFLPRRGSEARVRRGWW